MIELELLGIGADGESLVFTDPSGERYTTPITDELRGALRRERPQLDVVPEPAASLKPSQIQTLLRAGLTAGEVAAEHNVDLHLVQRFEPPIQAEKEYVLGKAQDVRVGGEPDGPRLSDLVVDRLATRGVSPTSIMWFARREVDSPWEVSVSFVQGAAEYAAHWHFDQGSGVLTAIDQEAQWLTETASQAPLHTIFPAVSSSLRDDAVDPQALSADAAQREALVDQLNAARGKRVEIDVDVEDDEDGADLPAPSVPAAADSSNEAPAAPPSISARIYSLAQAKTKRDDTSATASRDAAATNVTAHHSGVPSASASGSPNPTMPAASPASGASSTSAVGTSPSSDSAPGSGPGYGSGALPLAGSGSSDVKGATTPRSGAPRSGDARAAATSSAGTGSVPSGHGSFASGASRSRSSVSSSDAASSGAAGGRAADTLPGLDSLPPDDPAPKDKRRTKRRSVPSWDEIVFGSKP